MKFEFSPGLIGYGVPGTDGSAGLFGQAIYFTDRNPLSDFISIQNAIANNEVLWSSAAPGTTLPGDRKYANNDTFIDFRGFVYKINLSVPTLFNDTGAVLNKSTFFSNIPLIYTDNGFVRWHNKIDASSRFLIDNNMSINKSLNYANFPLSIYGIAVKDFTRIEHKDSSFGLYDGFTLWSSGQNVITDDNQSFGIVRSKTSNQFRIGNLNDSSVRNTNIILDVSLLTYTKETGNLFNKNIPTGTVLTNAEINTNLLFDTAFNPKPSSFYITSHGSWLILNWNLADFTSDTSVKGTIVFEKSNYNSGSWNIDASSMRSLMFYDVAPSGSFTINKLDVNAEYQYYMIIEKNGWERMSQIIRFTETGSPAGLTITNPVTKIATANNSGAVIPSVMGVDTTSITGWNAFSSDAWINITGGSSGIQGPGSFSVSTSPNTAYTERTGNINVTSEAPTQTISLTQARRSPINHNVYMSTYVNTTTDAKGRVNINPSLDPGQSITLNIFLRVRARADGNVNHNNITTVADMTLYKNGIIVTDCYVSVHSAGGDHHLSSDVTISIPGVVNGDILEIRQIRFDSAHLTSGINAYSESAGYMRLDSANDGWDSFNVTSMGQQFWSVTKYWGDGFLRSAVSSDGTTDINWVDGPDD